ncbi:TPA: gfo/Idh/MocA family oxidoreductase, partial [Candidatus Latescibacteria bacterium]|nr:gfo/Idh/MocA family oxidoreductase [Candidatus Latescibacterota bacterium]
AKFNRAKDIKVGVIGYGGAFNMGRRHLKDMQTAGMTPVCVTEVDPERRKVAEEEFPGIDTYASVIEMLKKSDVNLVVLITPHNTHAKLALQCLKAGRNVISEKPLAITTAECDAMIREAKKRRLVLTTYHNRHWDGCVLEALKHIKREKAIGDVYRVEAHIGGYGQPGDWWRSSKSISGGILYDWGVHLLEYALQIIDDDMTEVTGYASKGFWASKTAWKKDTNEDIASAVVRFKSGKWLTLTVSTIESNPKAGQLEISGTKGSYVFDGGTYELIHQVRDQKVHVKGKNMPSEWAKFYKNVANHLVKGTKLVITPEWARRPIHILDLAGQSVKRKKALPTKYR